MSERSFKPRHGEIASASATLLAGVFAIAFAGVMTLAVLMRAASPLADAELAGGDGAVPDSAPAAPTLASVLGAGADTQGFSRVEGPRAFLFPKDHGAHPDYRAEWWYFTGNLRAADDRHFGWQFTLFRFGLPRDAQAPVAQASVAKSVWYDGNLYMAHFALTDTAEGVFHAFERFARPPAASASTAAEVAESSMFSGWLDDWSLRFDGDTWRVRARDGAVAIDLAARPETPILLQGDAGFSVKGAAPGNASHYYSVPRLRTRGSVRTPAGSFVIEGTSWLDREWSTSALEPGQRGWDWFALQLADGRDLMFYRLRRNDGATDPHSAGVFVRPDPAGGRQIERLFANDVMLEPARFARIGAARYPVAWRLRLLEAAFETDLWVEARLPDQLHRGVFPYWEGAVVVREGGPRGPRIGEGYVELTGY